MHRTGLFLGIVAFFVTTPCLAQSFHRSTANSPEPGTVFVYPERIPLKAGGLFTADRGLLFAPLRRDKAGGDVVAVEFYRFPRTETADPGTPPLFLLNGGPSFSGLEERLKKLGEFEKQFQDFLNISDVVVVGQRGIGSSKPNTLIELSVEPQAVDQLFDQASATRQFQDALSKERRFWLDQGVDLTGFNVLECAGDVNDVAKALGYQKITILGGSFGSHWGMAIMRRYPDLVERAVLNGMEGPNHTWDHPGWLWNVYKRVAAEAEASDKLKDLIPEGGLIKAAESIVRRANENPITLTLGEGTSAERNVVLDGYAMQKLIRGFSNGLRGWPADIIQLNRGEFEQAARRLLMRTAIRRKEYSTASYWMLDSGSGITADRRAEFESDPAVDIVGSTFWHYAAGSPIWEFDLGDDFRQNFETPIPTLIVHGTWDTSTPYENALELAPFFKNGTLVTVKRGSHGAMGEAMRSHPDFREAVSRFLESGDQAAVTAELELPAPKWVVPKSPKN